MDLCVYVWSPRGTIPRISSEDCHANGERAECCTHLPRSDCIRNQGGDVLVYGRVIYGLGQVKLGMKVGQTGNAKQNMLYLFAGLVKVPLHIGLGSAFRAPVITAF